MHPHWALNVASNNRHNCIRNSHIRSYGKIIIIAQAHSSINWPKLMKNTKRLIDFILCPFIKKYTKQKNQLNVNKASKYNVNQ